MFDQDEIIQLTDFDDDEWWRGFKLRFNGSPNDISLFKEEGYFPRSHMKHIDIKNFLEFYSWYLPEERDMAVKILTRANDCSIDYKSLFMVRKRSEKEPGHAISLIHNNKIFHIKINENEFCMQHMNKENNER